MGISAPTIRPTEEAYGELQLAYDFFNTELFNGTLPPCLITFQRQKKVAGYFHQNRFGRRDGHTTDEIAINPEYFAVVPVIEVLQTTVHEMAHLWQHHFGNPSRAGYHNKEWADKMESLGLMPSDTGQVGGKRLGQQMADYVITGGRFESATKKLLAIGFAITWLDRFPCEPPWRFLVPQPGAPTDSQIDSPTTLERLTPNDEFEPAWIAPSLVHPALVEQMKTGNRSNRDKYTCPECSLNVWGKPGLRLRCEDCDRLLEPAAD